jgi:hypothetical protein
VFGLVCRVLWRTVRLELELALSSHYVNRTGAAESCCNSAAMGAWAESVQVSEVYSVFSGVLLKV